MQCDSIYMRKGLSGFRADTGMSGCWRERAGVTRHHQHQRHTLCNVAPRAWSTSCFLNFLPHGGTTCPWCGVSARGQRTGFHGALSRVSERGLWRALQLRSRPARQCHSACLRLHRAPDAPAEHGPEADSSPRQQTLPSVPSSGTPEAPPAPGSPAPADAASSPATAAAAAAAAGSDQTPSQHDDEASVVASLAVEWAQYEPFRTPVVQRKWDKIFAKWGKPGGVLNVDSLKPLAWCGVPFEYRYDTWRVLLGYMPPVWDRAQATLQRKRAEYWACVQQYYTGGERGSGYAGRSEAEQRLLRNILVDLPRTMPEQALVHTDFVQRALERVLYLWAVRHPASSYVQGINDLTATILVAFLSHFVGLQCTDTTCVAASTLHDVEADAYWCLTRTVDRIQDNYTPTQPGIQRMVWSLRELVVRLDSALVAHLEEGEESYEFQKFAFRWMNCLLTRELQTPLCLRLWDSYIAEDAGFEEFHTYVCAAMLLSWAEDIKGMEFQDYVMFFQDPPSKRWDVRTLQGVVSEAWVLKSTFSDAKGHLGAPAASAS